MYNTAVLMFKVHMGWVPQYVCDLLNRAPALAMMSFAFSGSSVWNSLPPKIKTYKSVRGFKVGLRKILIDK